ncbi:MAG: NAD(P)/FAD-dependent oxidoreductase [Actinomycetota bacterium]
MPDAEEILMPVTQRDVVIVGGGHNGLACAAYLAKAGLDVLVLERRSILGGAAATEETWPGYRISSASYVVSLLAPRIISELQLKRFGYEVSIISPDYFAPFPDGSSLTLWGDPSRDAEAVAKLSKHDAEALHEFDRYFGRIAPLLRQLEFVTPPNLSLRELPRWISLAARLRNWKGRDIAEVVRLFTISAADLLDEWFEDDRVKGALATQAVIGAWHGPMTPGSAYVLVHHWMGEVDGHEGAWGWVHGGTGGLSAALAKAAVAAGAEIRTDAAVARVAISGGRATGVELADGTEIRARIVVSNAHPVTTYLDLVGEAHLPDDVVRSVKVYKTKSGSVKVNVALGELPNFPSWDQDGDLHRGMVAISPSIEYLERAWDDAKHGRPSEHPYVEAMFPTAHEEGLAPEGKHIMLAFTQFGPYEVKDGSWETEREVYGQRVIETLGEFSPNLEGAVEAIEVLAPPDLEERFGLVGGNIFQGEMSPSQMFSLRPIPGYGDYRTPISGLYLCGGGTHPGGGVMAIPGRNAAQVVKRDAKRRSMTRSRRRASVDM